MDKESKGAYRQIIKATSIFGGVQVFNILISIIRGKIIAVLLGPAGMGIVGLFNSSTSIISGLTNLGLQTSAVKNISAANSTGNIHRISTVVSVFRKLIWVTGIVGTIITIVFAKQLSIVAFGNEEYYLSFILISITLLLTQINAGQKVLLQGMRKLQYLAKASITGTLSGLIVSVPIYYFWGIQGIIPTIILTSVFSLIGSWYFSSKIDIPHVQVSSVVFKEEARGMITMGIVLSLNGIMGLAASYFFKIYISRRGGVVDVGLYNAGYSIINTYVGMIFAAMITDYFPRLASVVKDRSESKKTIVRQAEITLLLLFPILCFFFIFIYWAVIILFSSKFVAIEAMIHWAALGILFKAVSWSMGVMFAANGDYRTLFWNELLSNIYILTLNILGYNLYGLTGIGISFFISFVLHFFQILIVSKIKYDFYFSYSFYKLYLIIFLISLTCFLLARIAPPQLQYTLGPTLICISLYYSYKELDKRIQIKELLKTKLKI